MLKNTGRGLAVLSAVLLGMAAPADAADKTLTKESFTFGTLTPPSEVAVRGQATQWLREHGTADRPAFDAVWARKDKPVLERLAATFALGDPDAAALLREARDPQAAAPTSL